MSFRSRCPEVWRQLLLGRSQWLGPEHPCTRAAFGHWVGARGGVLSAVGSGEQAWVANYRQRGYAGFRNRSARRALTAAWVANH